jgi:NAD(P) transhydrogenase subunit beta
MLHMLLTLLALAVGQTSPAATQAPSADGSLAKTPAPQATPAATPDTDLAPVASTEEEIVTGGSVRDIALSDSTVRLIYLVAAILFIFGIKGLTHPRTAVGGNLISAVGMLLAVCVTLLHQGIVSYWMIVIGVIVGGAVGAYQAVRVPMTRMPQLVALFNGWGGLASVLVAGGALFYETGSTAMAIATAAAGLIGAVTFTGSAVAFFKLEEAKWIPNGPLFAAQKWSNLALLVLCLVLGWWLKNVIHDGTAHLAYWLIVVLAAVLGILLTQPIGGADMPVVIALLNSYSGLAACASGFVINNNVLIIAGSLVGASGVILTAIMCKAMNRSLPNVVFGTMGPTGSTPSADDVYRTVKSASPEEVAMLMESAQKVVIVPGYGMAVSQCQHAVRDLTTVLEGRGCHVDFAIHPVAGRMPGHMNVLLAEANIPYEKLREMDDINPELDQYDVALVIGANDVVNPVARTDPGSPIAGMPIIDVDKSRSCVVIKRSLSPGFAGIPNPLFAAPNTLMLFGDGKKAMLELIAALKDMK